MLNTSLARVTPLHPRVRPLANTILYLHMYSPWRLQQRLGRIPQHIIPLRALWAACIHRSRQSTFLWGYNRTCCSQWPTNGVGLDHIASRSTQIGILSNISALYLQFLTYPSSHSSHIHFHFLKSHLEMIFMDPAFHPDSFPLLCTYYGQCLFTSLVALVSLRIYEHEQLLNIQLLLRASTAPWCRAADAHIHSPLCHKFDMMIMTMYLMCLKKERRTKWNENVERERGTFDLFSPFLLWYACLPSLVVSGNLLKCPKIKRCEIWRSWIGHRYYGVRPLPMS